MTAGKGRSKSRKKSGDVSTFLIYSEKLILWKRNSDDFFWHKKAVLTAS